MKVYHLPHDLGAGPAEPADTVIIRQYTSGISTSKNKIILHRNMINLLINGKKTIVYPDKSDIVGNGQLVILSTGNILTSEVLSTSEPFCSILLYFSDETLAGFYLKYQKTSPKDMPAADRNPFLIYDQDSYIRHYIQSLRTGLASPAGMSPEFRQIKLEELLLYLLEKDPARLHSLKGSAISEEDLHLKMTVESNIGKPVTIEELAFLCNTSPSTFQRRFKRIYGSSPQKWLLHRKMQLAAELLRHPSAISSRISEDLGYDNHSSFIEAFRQQYGITPAQYHRQNMIA